MVPRPRKVSGPAVVAVVPLLTLEWATKASNEAACAYSGIR